MDAKGGNIAINNSELFVAVNDKCLQLDIETGETITISLPPKWNKKTRRWDYIAVKDNILFGSVAMPLKQEYAQIFNNMIDENGNWTSKEELAPLDVSLSEYYKYGGFDTKEEVERVFQRDGTK